MFDPADVELDTLHLNPRLVLIIIGHAPSNSRAFFMEEVHRCERMW